MRRRVAYGMIWLGILAAVLLPRVMSGTGNRPRFVPLAASARAPLPVVVERDKALWISSDGQTRAIARASHYEKVTRGDQTIYAVLDIADPKAPAVCVLRADGHGRIVSQWRVRDAKLDTVTAIMTVQWVSDQRVFVDMHVNPSRGVGLTLDLQRGQFWAADMTTHAWSPEGGHLAWVLDPPHFTPRTAGARSEVWVDGTKMGEVPAGAWRRLSWTSESDCRLSTASGAKPLRVIIDRAGQPKSYTPAPVRSRTRR